MTCVPYVLRTGLHSPACRVKVVTTSWMNVYIAFVLNIDHLWQPNYDVYMLGGLKQ